MPRNFLAAPECGLLLSHSNGRPVTLYHATDASFSEFRPFSHFGTKAAALQIGGCRLLKVHLIAGSTLVVRDLDNDVKGANHSVLRLLDELHYAERVVSAAERDAVFRAAGPGFQDSDAGAKCLAGILYGKGWDSLAYRNLYEDEGSWSFIILFPWQVKILDDSIARP